MHYRFLSPLVCFSVEIDLTVTAQVAVSLRGLYAAVRCANEATPAKARRSGAAVLILLREAMPGSR
jgi:hypothetical protein